MLVEFLATVPAAFVATALVVGLLVGSFLNVVIHRVPIMLERQWREQCAELGAGVPASGAAPPSTEATAERFNLIVPRSRCPSCKAPITALQNIPIVSWLFLKGRCASCGAAISIRYPLVEGLCGLASALVAWKLGF